LVLPRIMLAFKPLQVGYTFRAGTRLLGMGEAHESEAKLAFFLYANPSLGSSTEA
jgi:hypothetical protein